MFHELRNLFVPFSASMASFVVVEPTNDPINDGIINILSDPQQFAKPKELIISLVAAIAANYIKEVVVRIKARRKLKKIQDAKPKI